MRFDEIEDLVTCNKELEARCAEMREAIMGAIQILEYTLESIDTHHILETDRLEIVLAELEEVRDKRPALAAKGEGKG